MIAEQRRDSAIHTLVSIPPRLPSRQAPTYRNTEQSSLRAAVGPVRYPFQTQQSAQARVRSLLLNQNTEVAAEGEAVDSSVPASAPPQSGDRRHSASSGSFPGCPVVVSALLTALVLEDRTQSR